jgi:hypothetical protein
MKQKQGLCAYRELGAVAGSCVGYVRMDALVLASLK